MERGTRALAFLGVLLVLTISEIRCSCDYGTKDGMYVLCMTQPRTVEVGQNTSFKIHTKPGLPETSSYYCMNMTVNRRIIEGPEQVELEGGNGTHTYITIHGRRAGTTSISFSFESSDYNITFYKLGKVKRDVSVIHSKPLDIVSMVVGWIYFVAWSVSFYPQIIENFWRRSVVGLNFDFLALNITGFIAYGVFNVGLFWIPEVKEAYMNRHPGGINPVQINDVVFTLHAIVATAFTIFQCFIFERGKQRVSYVAWIIVALLWLTVFISLFVSVGRKLSWLDFLYVFSYIKLVVTLIKYIPQAVMNCRRRSTVGWSIGNVLLDFTGGTFSILQMFLISYNYDDWMSIFGDPTKFGLGALSIFFDLVFMFQHYVLFWGKQPRDLDRVGYRKIEERIPNGPKGVVSDSENSDSNEATPLINGNKKMETGKCRQLLNLLHLS